MIEEIFFHNGALHVGDMVPWLSWLDPHGYVGRMKPLAKMFDRFIEHVLREHGDRRRLEGDAFVPRDIVGTQDHNHSAKIKSGYPNRKKNERTVMNAIQQLSEDSAIFHRCIMTAHTVYN